jgi:hypothetical protein
MDTPNSEQALRREAVRRRLHGESRQQICQDLARSPRWFDKWWAAYRHNPQTDFADDSRAPHHSPTRIPAALEQAIVNIREQLEAGQTPETHYGLIGNRAIYGQLDHLAVEQQPSLSAIQRILARHGLTHPRGDAAERVYYPWPQAWEVNALHATDIITRYIRGGETIQNFHTLDHYSQAVALSQAHDKRSVTMQAHLRQSWAHLGWPWLEQLDNEGAFRGGHTHVRVIGQVVRLCLFCNVELLFTPLYEAKRNYQVECFHSLWTQAFWSRQQFANLAHVQRDIPIFARWYHGVYRPPALTGQTPEQMRQSVALRSLTPRQQVLIPDGRLPITAGRLHVMRRVRQDGQIEVLNEDWLVGRKWIGEYVRATINTATQQLTIWHKADDTTPWRLLKTRVFRLKESVQDLLPAFRRNRARCLDYLPS